MNEIKARHFLFKHERCKGVFTVNSETFINYIEEIGKSDRMQCPSCGEKLLSLDTIKRFFAEYRDFDKMLAKSGYSIREIKEPIEPAKLRL